MSKKACIFDLDGTLSNDLHRRHYLTDKPKQWNKYMEMMINDRPYEDILYLLLLLRNEGDAILISTARDEKYRVLTTDWMMIYDVPYEKLYMRPDGDNRPSEVIKDEHLTQMRKDGYDPYMVFEDNTKVVQMFRTNGVRCLQVAPYGKLE